MTDWVPLKSLVTCNDETLPESYPGGATISYVEIGDVSEVAGIRAASEVVFADAPSRARRIVRAGDVIVSTVRTYLHAVAAIDDSHGVLIASTGFAVLRSRKADPRYVKYVVLDRNFMDEVEARSAGISYPAINTSDLVRIKVPIHSYPVQRAIADYLDREMARIDAFIAKNEELIALLKERRRATIAAVVDPLPGERRRLRSLYRQSREADHPDETVLSVYREYGVIEKSSRDDNFNVTPQNLERYLLVRPDDLVVNRMKAWQGSLGVTAIRGIVSGDYEVLRPMGTSLDPRFANYLLRSPRLIEQYGARSTGIRPAQWRLYWSELATIEVTVPSLREQRAAVDRIDCEFARIESGRQTAEQAISLARERRAALISAAVTGKIDVGVAA